MKYCLIFFICLLVTGQGRAQVIPQRETFRIWVKPLNGSATIQGILYKSTDSSLIISPDLKLDTNNLQEILVRSIAAVSLHRNYKQPVTRILLTTLVGGTVVGSMLALSAPDAGYRELAFLAGGAVGGGIGLLAGLIGVNARLTLHIKGSTEKYLKYRSMFIKRSIIKT